MSLRQFLNSCKREALLTLTSDVGLTPKATNADLRFQLNEYYQTHTDEKPRGFEDFRRSLDPGSNVERPISPMPTVTLDDFFVTGDEDSTDSTGQNGSNQAPPSPGPAPVNPATSGQPAPPPAAQQVQPPGNLTLRVPSNPAPSSPMSTVNQQLLNNPTLPSSMQNPLSTFVQDMRDAILLSVKNLQIGSSTPPTDTKGLRFFLTEGRQRRIEFSGEPDEDVTFFFKELDDLRQIFPISDSEMLRVLPEFLYGNSTTSF